MKFSPFRCLKTTVLLLIMGGGLCARAEIIEVRADSWPPYNAEPGSELPGYAVEVLKKIFSADTINYQTMPWQRAISEVKQGKIDAIIGASPTDGEGCVFPAEAVGVMKIVYFVKKGNPWKFDGVASLKPVKLGVSESYAYDDGELDAYIKASAPPAVQSMSGDSPLENNIKKLLVDRVDVVVENEPVMLWTLRRMKVPAGDIVAGGTAAAKPAGLWVAFSPAKDLSKARAEQFSKGIQELRASGELKKILDKYDA